jgi:trimeric autotransporter adhesin
MSAVRDSMRQPMRLSQRTPFIRGLAATVQYPLDDLDAAAAYSLRKLRTAYGGDAVNVRRSTDNLEIPIGFIGNELDTTALLSHCGAGNGFVTTWYDQSGNGRHATQTTAGNQPRIVGSGVIETQNGRPALFFDGSTFFDHPISISGPSTFVAVASRSGAVSEAQSIFFATPPNTQLDNGMWSKVTTSTNWGTYSDNFNSANADLTGALAVISTTSYSPPTGVIDMRTNGDLLASSGAARYSGDVYDRRRIGSEHPGTPRFHIGWISELPVFSSALSTTARQTLEHNQGEYYGITVS